MPNKFLQIILLFFISSLTIYAQSEKLDKETVIKYHIKSVAELRMGEKGKIKFNDTACLLKFDKNGNMIYKRGCGFAGWSSFKVYTYDSKNRLTKKEDFWVATEEIKSSRIEEYYYNQDGKLIKRLDKYRDDPEMKYLKAAIYKYDRSGNMIQYSYGPIGLPFHVINYTYNKASKMLTERTTDSSNIHRDNEFQYDSLNNIVKSIAYNSGYRTRYNISEKKNGDHFIIYYGNKYDEKGRLIEQAQLFNNERNEYLVWKYKYTEKDSVIEKVLFNTYRKGGYSHAWIDAGKVSKVSFHFKDSSQLENTFVQDTLEVTKYDDYGNKILYQEFYGMFTKDKLGFEEVFQFDKNNRLIYCYVYYGKRKYPDQKEVSEASKHENWFEYINGKNLCRKELYHDGSGSYFYYEFYE